MGHGSCRYQTLRFYGIKPWSQEHWPNRLNSLPPLRPSSCQKVKIINIYTDKIHICYCSCSYGHLWRTGFTSKDQKIKNAPQILDLLATIWMLRQVAITHCKTHQMGDDPVIWGNNMADATTQKVATKSVEIETALTLLLIPPTLSEPIYTWKDLHLAAQLREKPNIPGGWSQSLPSL